MRRFAPAAAMVVCLTASAIAADGSASLFEAVTRCRMIADPAERVACYDRSVEALQAAERRKEVAIVDRAQISESKRALFGLSLPRLPVFGRAEDGTQISQINSTVASAAMDRGNWLLRLVDGSKWRQIDDNELGRRPRAGDKVIVKRAALGSFRMSIAGTPGIKVRREI